MDLTRYGPGRQQILCWLISLCCLTVPSQCSSVYLGCIDQRCYNLITEPKSWDGALTACKTTNSTLATIDSSVINSWLQGSQINRHDSWIGTRGYQLEQWYWLNGDKLSSGVGFQDDGVVEAKKSCGYLTHSGGDTMNYWSGACWHNMKAICQTYVGDNTDTCIQSGGSVNGNICYQAMTSENTWFRSREHCQSMGGDLAIVNSPEVGGQVAKVMDGVSKYWMGVWKQVWRWANGPDVMWTNWLPQTPDISQVVQLGWAQDSCVMRRADGYWLNQDCDRQLPYICEQDMNVAIITTVNPGSRTEAAVETSGEETETEPGRIILGGKDRTILIASLVGVMGVLLVIAVALGIAFGIRRHRQRKEPPPADPAVGYENVSFAPAPGTAEAGDESTYKHHIYADVGENQAGENPYEELPQTYQVSLRNEPGSSTSARTHSQRTSGPNSQRTSGRGSQSSGQGRDSQGREVDLSTLYARPDKTKKSRGSGVRDSGRGTSLEDPDLYGGAPILPPRESANTTLY